MNSHISSVIHLYDNLIGFNIWPQSTLGQTLYWLLLLHFGNSHVSSFGRPVGKAVGDPIMIDEMGSVASCWGRFQVDSTSDGST